MPRRRIQLGATSSTDDHGDESDQRRRYKQSESHSHSHSESQSQSQSQAQPAAEKYSFIHTYSHASLNVQGHGNGNRGNDRMDDSQHRHRRNRQGDSDGSEGSDDSEDRITGPFWRSRMAVGRVVNNEYVQLFVIFLIVINAISMGIATFDMSDDSGRALDRLDMVFLSIFTIEVGAQLFYLGFTLFQDGWLFFDFLIVVISWSLEEFQIVRAFRIFRAFRLITRVKPLRDLVLAIGAVLPRMYAIGALLLLIFYIFSILFTELFHDVQGLDAPYFNTLDKSLFTCMEMMTLEWGEIARQVMDEEKYAWAPFVAFIAITGFIVFNLIVAVICDAVAITEKTVREMDGHQPDTTEARLEEAQERIDLLQSHINDMLRTQQAVQDMIEAMAGEMLHLEAERKRSEQRAVDLRIEFERRLDYQRVMEAQRQEEYERKLTKRNMVEGLGQMTSRASDNSLSNSLHSKRRSHVRNSSDDEESSSCPRSPIPVARKRRGSHRRSARGDSNWQIPSLKDSGIY